MTINDVVIGNVLSGLGVAFLLFGHYFISTEKFRHGYKSAAFGGLMVMLGSILLESWAVVALNLVWIGLSLEGLRLMDKKPSHGGVQGTMNEYLAKLLPLTFIVGMILNVTGHPDMASWACTTIYLLGYWLQTSKRLSNQEYMLWTFLGFFLLINHLVEHQSYSVLFNETIGALISLNALLGYLKASDGNAPTAATEPAPDVQAAGH